LKARKRKYKLKRTGLKFGKMIKLYFAIVYLYRLLKRFCNEKIQKVADIWFTPEFFNDNVVYGTPTWNLWVVPGATDELYLFCQDERISMRNLLNNLSLGRAPPLIILLVKLSRLKAIAGFVHNFKF